MGNLEILLPVAARYCSAISQSFSEHKQNAPKLNPGVDWAVPIASDILDVADGTVKFAGMDPYGSNYNGGYGLMVKIGHGDLITTVYGHLSKILVKQGDEVQAGQVIAESGNTGNSTGPHLHFELRISGRQVDPIPYLVTATIETAPAPESDLPRVLAPSLNIRMQPSRLGIDVGDLLAGQQPEIIGAPVVAFGVSWVPIRLWVAEEEDGEKYIG